MTSNKFQLKATGGFGSLIPTLYCQSKRSKTRGNCWIYCGPSCHCGRYFFHSSERPCRHKNQTCHI